MPRSSREKGALLASLQASVYSTGIIRCSYGVPGHMT